jgi:hypothetical protein
VGERGARNGRPHHIGHTPWHWPATEGGIALSAVVETDSRDRSILRRLGSPGKAGTQVRKPVFVDDEKCLAACLRIPARSDARR